MSLAAAGARRVLRPAGHAPARAAGHPRPGLPAPGPRRQPELLRLPRRQLRGVGPLQVPRRLPRARTTRSSSSARSGGKSCRSTPPRRSGKLHQMMAHWGATSTIDALPALGQLQPTSWYNGRPGYDREPELRVWDIPPSWAPNTFKKTAFTDEELLAAIGRARSTACSPEVPHAAAQLPALAARQGPPRADPRQRHARRGGRGAARRPRRPRLVAQGRVPQQGAVHLRGQPGDGCGHDQGCLFSQRMVTVIRCADEDGTIHTFSNTPQEETGEGEEAAA